jgi:hypothetical protein
MIRSDDLVPVFIPSYHRPDNVKTAKYFVRQGWDPKKIYVVIDTEADDRAEYEANCRVLGVNLRIFDIEEGRRRFDFVHRASVSRRAAGLARNCFYEIAEAEGIDFYCVIDDDTRDYQVRPTGKYIRQANGEDIAAVFSGIRDWMRKRHIGCWGLSQTGDLYDRYYKLIRRKVMNTTFYDTRFIYRGERGVQDDDTSQFVGIMNEGYFTGSMGSGLILSQTPSATSRGGLTDLYHECKLLNKALVTPIQFPSCIRAEKQMRNGGRLHHRIQYRYLYPCLLRGERDNIAWDAYPEDGKFTNEPKRKEEGRDE